MDDTVWKEPNAVKSFYERSKVTYQQLANTT